MGLLTADDSSISDDYSEKKKVLLSFKDAVREHDKALKELSASLNGCVRALLRVASSFEALSANTRTPVVMQSSAALRSGLDGVRSSCGLDDLEEEIEYSVEKRFQELFAEHKRVDESRKLFLKSREGYQSLRSRCEKLERKRDKPDALSSESQKRDTQELEYKRLHADFDDNYNTFVSHLGDVMTCDVSKLSDAIHSVLSLLSYQFRRCHENMISRDEKK